MPAQLVDGHRGHWLVYDAVWKGNTMQTQNHMFLAPLLVVLVQEWNNVPSVDGAEE